MKILIAVDESDYIMKVVRYVASIVKSDVQITLFNVLPSVSAASKDFAHPLFTGKMDELRAIVGEKKKLVQETAEKAKTIFNDAGIPNDNIEIKIVKKQIGIARDIIAEAEKGAYDTVVIGRRGLSATAAFVLGSVSNKIVQNIKSRTVWIVE